MDVCHILLRMPWKYDKKSSHDGRKNTYYVEKDGRRHTLSLLKYEAVYEAVQEGSISNNLLMTRKELLQEVKKEEEQHFPLVGKPKVILTSTNLDDLPIEVKILLDNYVDYCG